MNSNNVKIREVRYHTIIDTVYIVNIILFDNKNYYHILIFYFGTNKLEFNKVNKIGLFFLFTMTI